MTLPIEDALEGKYEILEKIGEGGIGSVYKVRHRLLDEVRVIKVLRPQVASKEDHQERFLHEARMAIRLKHPNIAQLHDFSISDEGTAFIVMEFIDGIALDALLEANGPPSLELTLEVSRQSLRALGYLHRNDLVHRDVSPDNIMLTTSFDGRPRVKLIDMGIAKNLAEETGLTQTGVFLGKVRYCSPEQFSSTENQTAELDYRSDLYSYGLLLYELLTGVYPFGGKTFAELAGCHLFQPPISFDETDPEGKIPPELRAVVLKALEKDPKDRFESAEEFSRKLEEFGEADDSIAEELNRTVERTTSTITNFKQYTRPGSTQDRLNAQFGLGTTKSKKPLTALVDDKTQAAGSGAPASQAPRAPWTPQRKWILAAAIGAVALVAGTMLAWRFVAGSGDDSAAQSPAQLAEAIEVEPTQAFSFDESEGSDLVSTGLPIPPPPLEQRAAEGDPAQSQQPLARPEPGPGPEGGPPPRRPPPDQRPGPQGGPPPGGPGSGRGAGERPVERSTEIYQRGVGVVPPVLTVLAPTIYPDDKKPRSEMVVVVEVLVDEFGKVLTAKAVSGGGFRRRYRDPAVETAKRSLFRPAMKNGVAGRMWTRMRVVFEAE